MKTAQTEFEESVTDALDRQLKGIMTVVKQQVQKLCEEFCSELQVTSHDVEVT
jgi:hypothetical protein